VTARVARVNDKNELEFYCNFTVTPPQTEYFFIVEWGISTGLSITDRLLETQPIKYGDFNTFVKSTALTEHILRRKGFGRLGITVRFPFTVLSEEHNANNYIKGICSLKFQTIFSCLNSRHYSEICIYITRQNLIGMTVVLTVNMWL
jgi:hypothetical protein